MVRLWILPSCSYQTLQKFLSSELYKILHCRFLYILFNNFFYIFVSDITYGQIYSQAPFEAPLVAFDLKGSYLKAALENSVSRFNSTNNISSSTSFVQVSGLKIVYDLNKSINERVISVKVRCASCQIPIFEDLQNEAEYRILATRYVATGGYGFSIFKEYGTNAEWVFGVWKMLLTNIYYLNILYEILENMLRNSNL